MTTIVVSGGSTGIGLVPTRVNCVTPGFVAAHMHNAKLVAGPDVVRNEVLSGTVKGAS